ncbi:MAG: histidine kinase [Sphingomonadaceae bacterium]|nr:histidine kinase [Sphingomonadaceae bacterium]
MARDGDLPQMSSTTADGGSVQSWPALPPVRHHQRTLGLVALIWFASGTLFMLPYLLRGGLDFAAVVSHYSVATVGLALSLLLLVMARRLQALSGAKVFVYYALTVAVLAAMLGIIDIALFEGIHAQFERDFGAGRPVGYLAQWSGNFAIFSSQFSLIAVAFWTLETLEAYRRQQAELAANKTIAAEARSQANRAKLSALRYQLNPHFLFNTLNSISSLVVTQRNQDAEMMIARLSEFLRTTLTSDPTAAQTLEGELETVDAYLGLERIRFGERLEIAIDCPPDLRDALLPHFLLQPLVENAVKHGLAPSDAVVTISISARKHGTELLIAVENDVAVGDAPAKGGGLGLRNVRERLEAV